MTAATAIFIDGSSFVIGLLVGAILGVILITLARTR